MNVIDLLTIPEELQVKIIVRLKTIYGLGSLQLVCKHFHRLISDDLVWKKYARYVLKVKHDQHHFSLLYFSFWDVVVPYTGDDWKSLCIELGALWLKIR